MSEKHSIASKNRWKNVPFEKRQEIMRALQRKRMLAMTKEERSAYGKMMADKKKTLRNKK